MNHPTQLSWIAYYLLQIAVRPEQATRMSYKKENVDEPLHFGNFYKTLFSKTRRIGETLYVGTAHKYMVFKRKICNDDLVECWDVVEGVQLK